MENWSYEEAFKRNLGLINPQEQQILRNSRVAIPGMGGVGGIHAVTLARLGIGKFTIADPDVIETANFNRQYGASVSSLGKVKVDVMEKIIKDINPEAEIRVFRHPIGPDNVDDFLDGSHLVIDGIDAFAIDARRLVTKKAATKGLYVVGAGPIGFSTAWLVFDPHGMGFDEYFDISDKLTLEERLIAFIVGLTPKSIHRSYMDYNYISLKDQIGPSSDLACDLCAGVAAAESLKILLKRGGIKPVPYYQQFDPYRGKLVSGRLWMGNRGPLQRLKRKFLAHYIRRMKHVKSPF